MKAYGNQSGKSGITAYHYTDRYIDIQFRGGKVYRYKRETLGELKFWNMVTAAVLGTGLNTFINKSVRKKAA